jgi:hypothetical protein
LRCFDRNYAEIFANSVILGFHSDGPDPLISTAAVVIQHLDVWWGKSAIKVDPTVTWPAVALRYDKPESVTLHEDSEFRISICSGLGASHEMMKHSLKEEIRIELVAARPRPLSMFQKRVHACQDVLSVACQSLCTIQELRLVPSSDAGDQSGTEIGTYHAVPIFKEPGDREPSWPDLLFRGEDIRPRAQQVFSAWLGRAEDLRVVRSLYLSAAYGKGFIEVKLLALAQAAEAYHRRFYDGVYMREGDFEKRVFEPLKAAIPRDVNSSLGQALRSRLQYANEYSFRRRLRDLFTEHDAALATVAPIPCQWVSRIVEHRNSFTHHPVIEDQPALDRTELLKCIYVLRILLDLCFLKSMEMTSDEITKFSGRCLRYQQIKARFFSDAKADVLRSAAIDVADVKLPARVQTMFDADAANIRVSPTLMAALHPWAVTAFDETAELFRFIYQELGKGKAEGAQDEKLREIARAHGMSDEELITRLKNGQAADIEGADAAWKRLWTLRVVKIVVMTCQRYWSWGAAELFRLRITAAHGYLRLEAEALALAVLFLGDEALADRWSKIADKKEGQKFFRETQPSVKKVLTKYDLNNTYDIASGGSQHVRMAGLVRALNTKDGGLGLPDQDFNKDDPYSFHLAIAHFHRIQSRILPALGSVLLDENEEWKAMETQFVKRAGELWQILEQRYKKEIQEQGAEE